MQSESIPSYFWWRRLHSLMGLGLALYIIFHLFTNSQAALWVGDDGKGFIRSVNAIQEIPYLIVVEFLILALPIAIHALLGLHYLTTGESNSLSYDGKTPYLPEYGRNRAYTWQRITSWILLVGILLHVVQMRFWERPQESEREGHRYFTVSVTEDQGLAAVSQRLGVQLFPQQEKKVIAYAKDYGTAELLMVRETFKSPWMMLFYTLFVWTACFHAFNGMWTFMIKWGVTLTDRSQKILLKITTTLMLFVFFLGLAAIYGTYWINLRS